MKLKLYVWENSLTDYKDGIMLAFAENESEARNLIEKEMGYEPEDLAKNPTEIKEKKAFYVFGSM